MWSINERFDGHARSRHEITPAPAESLAGWFVHGFPGVSFCNTVQNISIIDKSASVPLNQLAQSVRIGAR